MGYPRSLNVDVTRALEDAAMAGRIYTISFGTSTLTGTVGGLSLFNSATARKFIVIGATAFNQTSVQVMHLRMTTTDPALGTTPTIVNNMVGGPTSLATVSLATTGVTVATGTLKKLITASTNSNSGGQQFLFKESDYITLPAGQNNGVLLIINGASGNTINAEIVWAEI